MNHYNVFPAAFATDFNFLQACVFACLLSAMELVPTLSLLNLPGNNCGPVLWQTLFGESLNEVSVIALFDTLMSYDDSDFGVVEFVIAVALWICKSLGGFAMGTIVALICSFVLKRIRLDEHPSLEFLVISLFAFSSFLLAQLAQLSGIVSIFFCGVVLQHYNWYNISEEGKHCTEYGFSAGAQAAEAGIYIFLGLKLALSFRPSSDYHYDFNLIISVFALLIISRFIYTIVVTNLLNIGRKQAITFRMQLFIFYSCIRGSICFALSLSVPNPNANYIIPTTILMVLITMVIIGSTISKVISLLSLRHVVNPPLNEIPPTPSFSFGKSSTFGAPLDSPLANDSKASDYQELEVTTTDQTAGGFHLFWRSIDQNYFKPIFGSPMEDRSYQVEGYGGHDIQHL